MYVCIYSAQRSIEAMLLYLKMYIIIILLVIFVIRIISERLILSNSSMVHYCSLYVCIVPICVLLANCDLFLKWLVSQSRHIVDVNILMLVARK